MMMHDKQRLLAQKQAALDAILSKVVGKKCLVCDSPEWQECGVFSLSAPHNLVSESTPGCGSNIVVIQCKGCGQILLFDAKSTGADVKES
jgi:hypothetical protein